ncbi:hypothetical protein J2X20_001863 [Pelomonas saccharophila]|uniref:Cell wall hydrolase SleB domain-containing protein n=1 Tax=Roseateles saccharophilus TaxID=304 RepID=A0ABU1YK51_ROSSA|nr:cell wall hydrolase [Roseateles saccharophilus]MDR7269234.1 hypothetical protein [Roseateles saccharophilus]
MTLPIPHSAARGLSPWQEFKRLGHCLAGRGGGPDWAVSEALNALWLTLPGPGHALPRLHVAVRDGVPLSALPARWTLPGTAEALPLVRVRAPRACLQSAPELRPRARPALVGSATALLRAQDGGRSYLLTCAHVAVPDLLRGFGDEVDLSHASATGRCSVVDWRPAPQAGTEHSAVDAALLSLDPQTLLALQTDGGLLPSGLAGRALADQAVSMRSHRGDFPGQLKVYWSGPVDLPGVTPGVADYFLDRAIGYCCSSRSGDSGAAVWDTSDRLLGMHLAGIDGVGSGEPNAIYGPIAPVLEAFRVRPWLRGGQLADVEMPAIVPARPSNLAAVAGVTRAGSAPTVSSTTLSDREVVACTLWGEARNQGERGMRAVASVIANRWHSHYRRRQSAREVCLDPWQFSCWLKNDPNLPRMLAVARQPDAPYQQALALADPLLQGTLQDITQGARHYFAVTLRKPPAWAAGKSPCAVIGDHLFFNDVD